MIGIVGNLCVLSSLSFCGIKCVMGQYQYNINWIHRSSNTVWYQKSETETQKNCRTIRSSCNGTRDTFSTSWKNTTFSCGKIWCNLCLICPIVTYNKIWNFGIICPSFLSYFTSPTFWNKKSFALGNPHPNSKYHKYSNETFLDIFKTLWKAGILIICFSHTGKSGQTSNPLRDLGDSNS